MQKYIAIDTETTGTDFKRGARPFVITTCTEDGDTGFWRGKVDPISRAVTWSSKDLTSFHKRISGYTPVYHNAKFDVRALRSIGIDLAWDDYEDTLLASHAVSSTDNHGLKELSIKYLEYSDKDEQELHQAVIRACNTARGLGWTLGEDEKGNRQVCWDYWIPYAIDPEDTSLETYAVADVERTILLWDIYNNLLKEQNLWEGYCVEKRLQKTVVRVESCGLQVNLKKCQEVVDYLTNKIDHHKNVVTHFVEKAFGDKVNPGSDVQMRKVLHDKDKFALPVLQATETGLPSLNKDTLNELYDLLEPGSYEKCIVRHMLTSSAYSSGRGYLKNYFVSAFKNDTGDMGVIYPSLNQLGARTGRFSSSNPNGQNVGKRDKADVGGKEIAIPKLREVFCPRKGHRWYSIDYSQIELRVFACASKEQSLIDALAAGYDFHGFVACRIFNKPIGEISEQERTIAKNVNFALIFGAKEDTVNKTAGIDDAYELFANQFTNVASYMKEIISQVKKTGHVRTLDGYRLKVPMSTPYKGVNYLVQGTAGRIIKKAMIKVDDMIDWDEAKMLLQIHDELILEVKIGSKYDTPEFIFSIMEAMESTGTEMGVVTPVSCEVIDRDWGHVKAVEVTKTEFVLAA